METQINDSKRRSVDRENAVVVFLGRPFEVHRSTCLNAALTAVFKRLGFFGGEKNHLNG